MPTYAIGNRTRLVLIEALQGVSSGFPREDWIPLRLAWMERIDKRGGEVLKAGEFSAQTGTTWRTAYAADLDPEILDLPKVRRLRYQDRLYDIQAATIDPDTPVKHCVTLDTLAKVG